jgi:3-hydroxyisobutyrate dehydrogenase-like beta-hydroxyacid dehydrogenase
VSGGQAGAVNGQLGIMCGGDEAVFARAKPVLDIYAKSCVLIGEAGAGQLCKMVNQIAIAGLLQGLGEAINFGKKSGLDIEKVIAVISKGAAQSWQMENRWKTMNEVKFDGFGFAVDWMRKDLGICLEEAKRNGARLPATALIDTHTGARGGSGIPPR